MKIVPQESIPGDCLYLLNCWLGVKPDAQDPELSMFGMSSFRIRPKAIS